MEQIKQRIEWIGNLFQSVEPIYLWCYNEFGHPIATNCPDDFFPDTMFDLKKWREAMLDHFDKSQAPYIMGSPFGITWMCVIHKAMLPQKYIYVLGPVTTATISLRQLRLGLDKCRQQYTFR